MRASPAPRTVRPAIVRPAAALVALALLVAACSDDGDDLDSGVVDDTTATSDDTTDPDGDAGDTTTTGADTSTSTSSTAADDSTTSTTAGDGGATTLPGEDIDLFIDEGDVLAVVGVADDDELNVRQAPGADQPILTSAGPTADDLVATGRARQLPASIWFEVTVDGQTGWVSSSFVAFLGGTTDDTARYLAEVANGVAPGAETLTDLGRLVAEGYASDEPPSEIVQTVAPSVGDLGEVTYDVVGLGDDAVRGVRLHIFATEDDSGEAFTLRTIELTTLCTRGVAGELCT